MFLNKDIINIKFAGIGGMGVLKASLIFSEAVFRSGADVKKAEVHGMSQRGGSLCSDVRFGKNVFSPMIPKGEVDILVLLQDDQLPLYQAYLNQNAIILKASQIDITKLSNRKSLNIAMLGLLSTYLSLDDKLFFDVIKENLPDKLYESNHAAFLYGKSIGEST